MFAVRRSDDDAIMAMLQILKSDYDFVGDKAW